jgi:hypothetical protein
MMLSIISIIMPTYDESRNTLSLLDTIRPKEKPESRVGELVVNDNSPNGHRRAMEEEEEEELARYIWTLPSRTTATVSCAINDSENDSLGEGGSNDHKNYLIKVTHRVPDRYGLISRFHLKDIWKSMSFFSKSAGSCTVEATTGFLRSCLMLPPPLDNALYANFSCMYVTPVGIISPVTSNSLLNRIRAFMKIYGGRRLLPFRSLF